MKYYLTQKVRWLFNSFLTKMLIRSSIIALAGNGKSIYEEGGFENQMFGHRTEVQWCNSVEGRTSTPFL